MKLCVEWTEPGQRSLRRIHWRDASRVAAAVERFAETGEGEVVRLATDDTLTARLRVPPYSVRLSIIASEMTIVVWGVYRLR